MSVEVVRKDRGLKKLWRDLDELNKLEIVVGFVGADGRIGHPLASVNVATVALYNEFGTINAPARPFMRSTFKEHGPEFARAFAKEYALAVEGKQSPVKASGEVARLMTKRMRERIDKSPSWATPNARSTIRKKGHAHPLIGGHAAKGVAGGTMQKAIGWEVRRSGSKVLGGK